jgi:hypothetical protein
MGCSNTINLKKGKIKSNQFSSKESNFKNNLDSAGTNDGKSSSYEKDSNINKKVISIDEGEVKEIPKNFTHLKVEANCTEQLFPVWIEKGVKIRVYVKGRWSLFPEYGMVNYQGHSTFNYKHRDLNIGALIGRVQGGSYFSVTNEMIIKSDVSGPLYLFANNSRFAIQPQGSLDVYLDYAKTYSNEEIEDMLGWNLKEIDTTTGCNYLTNEEKSQIIFLNKIKINPKKFAEQYLKHLIDQGESFKELYQKLLHFPTSKLLKPLKALYLAAFDHARDIGENGTTGHTSTDGSDLRARVSKYSINPSYFGENCSYNLKDPLSIIIQLVVDDGLQSRIHRANILNEIYTQIGVSIQPHSSYKWTCVQVFGANIVEKNNI